MITFNVAVNLGTPSWNDSGVTVSAGDAITVTADPADTWAYGPGLSFNALGDPSDFHHPSAMVYEANIDELCGFIGASDPSGTIHGPGYAIGLGKTWIAEASGKLWLGQNDAVGGTFNNSGGPITVTISEPGDMTGIVYHYIDALAATTTHPMNNVKIDITMYSLNAYSILEYSYTYSSVYTNSSGVYFIGILVNPFNVWDWQYYTFELNKLLYGSGWTHAHIIATTCSSSTVLDMSWSHSTRAIATMYILHSMTENLHVIRSSDSAVLENASANMYSTYLTAPNGLTDVTGLIQFTVYPTNVTHSIQKSGYTPYTPIYDLYTGHDCQVCTVSKTASLVALPAVGGATITFTGESSIGYYPSDTMQLNYNVGEVTGVYRTGAYIKLFKPDGSLAIRIPESGGLEPYVFSPPTKNYTPTTSGMRGMWIASLYDNTNTVIASDSTFFGTKGFLSHDTSSYCSLGQITIYWSNIDPVEMDGSRSSRRMSIEVYNSSGALRYTHEHDPMDFTSGSFTLTITGEDITNNWRATLTDQWGIVIDTEYIHIVPCNQKLFGNITGRNGIPISGATIGFDLTDMGFGTYSSTSDANGTYMISNFPPFSTHTVTCSKLGYAAETATVTVNTGDFVKQDFVLNGDLNGKVIDSESNPITNATVWITGESYIAYTDDMGIYDIPVLTTGSRTLNAIKNNFVLSYQTANLTNLAVELVKNFTLSRKAIETYAANLSTSVLVCETAGIQLDDVNNISIDPFDEVIVGSSGQQIAVVDYTNSLKGDGIRTVNTGQGAYDVNPMCVGVSKIPIGGTLRLDDHWVLKATDIDLNNRTALIQFLYDGSQVGDQEILYSWTDYTFVKNTTTFSISVKSIFTDVELQSIELSVCWGIGSTESPSGKIFAQLFETDFNFNHIAVRLLFSKTYYAPCRINVKLFDNTGYTAGNGLINFTTPIFKDNIVLNPGDANYIHFYFRTQLPGHYCIRIENEDSGNITVYGRSPNTYRDSTSVLMTAYNNGLEVGYSIETRIYEAPIAIERFLIRAGAKDTTEIYTVDSKNTNLVTIE